MDPIGSLPPQLESFGLELSNDLHTDLGGRAPAGRYGAAPTIGFPGSLMLVENLTRAALNFAAQSLGPAAEAFILANKDAVRAWIGEPVLEAADRILHGLEDAKAQAGA